MSSSGAAADFSLTYAACGQLCTIGKLKAYIVAKRHTKNAIDIY
jgi:hypothetical protein